MKEVAATAYIGEPSHWPWNVSGGNFFALQAGLKR